MPRSVPARTWGATVRQTAVFDPVGLMGLLYWYGIYPLHALVFTGMLRAICEAAERNAGNNNRETESHENTPAA